MKLTGNLTGLVGWRGMVGSVLVCHRLQENPATKHIPVIMLTVKGQVDDPALDERTIETRIQEQMAGFEVGAVDFLTKPVKAGELIERIKSLLFFEQS